MKRIGIVTLLLLLAVAPMAPAFADDAERSSRAEEELAEGKQRLEKGDYEGAVGVLQEAMDDAPDDEEIAKVLSTAQNKAAERYLAECLNLLLDKQFDQASNELDSAAELAPKSVKVEKAKKAVPYIRRGLEYLDKKERAKASADFKKAYELWPDPAIKKLAAGA
jgi:Tfp pilus assembly protein PilF